MGMAAAWDMTRLGQDCMHKIDSADELKAICDLSANFIMQQPM